jgi:hypothetical protein
VRKNASLILPPVAISTKSSHPASTPQNPSTIRSTRLCRRFFPGRRGSAIVCSLSTRAHVIAVIRTPSDPRLPLPLRVP